MNDGVSNSYFVPINLIFSTFYRTFVVKWYTYTVYLVLNKSLGFKILYVF